MSQAEPQATDPAASSSAEADPARAQKVELGKAFAFQLLKGLKQIAMYRHNEGKFPEFLTKAHEALTSYTETHGALSLKVEAQNLLLYGEPLFAEDSPLPYRFYRDGIRQLIFRPGMPLQELVTLTLIALTDSERGGEDLVNQLWRSGLSCFEYIVVEGFKLENVSEEQVQVEVDQIVGYLYSRLKTTSDDFMRFARLSTEDLEAELDGIEQIRGAVVKGSTADDALKAKLQKELVDEEARLFPKLVTAVFQVVEGGIDDASLLDEMFIQLLDSMLLQEDFATINQLVAKLDAMARKDGSGGLERLRNTLVSKMGDEQRLVRVGEVLRNSRPRSPMDVQRYLQLLGPEAVIPLLTALETIEIPENRALLYEILAKSTKDKAEPVINRLESERPQTVRDMVTILEKSQHPDRMKLFGQVLKSPNLAVKLDVLGVIARGKTGEARKLLVQCLADPQPQMRMQAARLLNVFDREAALADLSKAIRDPSFEKRGAEEKAVFFAALGATGLPGAVTEFQHLLQVKPSLFNKAKVLEDKLLAIQGLVGAASIQSYKVLQELVEDKTQPADVLTAARKAMYQTKKTLFGENAPAEGA